MATWSRRILPGVAAAGGMLVPTFIFLALNYANPATLRGWAIPTATDIAFALGVVSLLGSRVPLSLKVFLTALAIIDDLGAVLLIALVYTVELSLPYLLLAALMAAILLALNSKGIARLSVYLLLGCLLWFFVLRSGVHPTVAGVMLAFMIPLGAGPESFHSPLLRLEHGLQPWVSFVVVPVFGLANAGVSFDGVTGNILTNSLTSELCSACSLVS